MKKSLCAIIALLAIVVWGGFLPVPPGGETAPPSPDCVPTATPEEVPTAQGIEAEEAEKIALALFPEVQVDRKTVELTDGGDDPSYECEILTQDEKKIQVWIDPATGDPLEFSVGSRMMDRPAEPLLSTDEAREVARAYVDENCDGADLTLTSERYHTFSSGPVGTVADRYSFSYARLIRGVPCLSDGFSISVDAVTSEVCRYSKRWKTNEDLCTADTVPSVSGEDAKDAVRAYLKETWGDLPGLTVHTADLRWRDRKTGSTDAVPLVWEVRFDDDHYRSLQYPHDINAFVEAHTGEVLDSFYHPDAA